MPPTVSVRVHLGPPDRGAREAALRDCLRLMAVEVSGDPRAIFEEKLRLVEQLATECGGDDTFVEALVERFFIASSLQLAGLRAFIPAAGEAGGVGAEQDLLAEVLAQLEVSVRERWAREDELLGSSTRDAVCAVSGDGSRSGERMAEPGEHRLIGRLTGAFALVAVLAWSCLLFGVGLDDLTNDHTRPGVIFSLVVLPIFIGGALYGIGRLLWLRFARRSANPS